jgi:GntR family transcriptional regulator, transcriptional repressor for pyruvate dehydrogenase complex
VATHEKVASEVARRVMREAASDVMAPGDLLSSEADLIEHLQVSRGSAREGLRVLESMGAIRLRRGPGGGATLSKPRPEHLASSLAMMLQFDHGTLGTILEARNVIEPTMAALAARRRSEAHVAQLFECTSILRTSLNDSEQFHDANRRFHDLVAEASGNILLAVLMPALSWMSAAVGWEHPVSVRKRIAREKSEIAEAIADGDSWLASERMKRTTTGVVEIERQDPDLLKTPIIWADVDELLADRTDDA